MSFTSPNIATQQAFRRQKKALFQRLRHNFLDKCIALLSGVVLFVFVQTEHNTNPQFLRPMQAEVVYDHKPADLDLENLQRQVPVTVTGPKFIVENLHAGDVRATADLSDKTDDVDHQQVVMLAYTLPHSTADIAAQIHIDGAPSLKIMLHSVKSKPFVVKVPDYSAPAGYHFGTPVLKPISVICSGRKDRVDQIAKIVVSLYSLATLAPNANKVIQGDVDVDALDHEGNIVQGVNIDHKIVHLQLPLIENEMERNVTVSTPMILPTLPWAIEKITVEPPIVKIKGMKNQIDQIYTLSTDTIDLHEVTGAVSREMTLASSANVKIFDLDNKPVNRVIVTVTLRKLATGPGSNQNTTQPGTPNGPSNPGVPNGD